MNHSILYLQVPITYKACQFTDLLIGAIYKTLNFLVSLSLFKFKRKLLVWEKPTYAQ